MGKCTTKGCKKMATIGTHCYEHYIEMLTPGTGLEILQELAVDYLQDIGVAYRTRASRRLISDIKKLGNRNYLYKNRIKVKKAEKTLAIKIKQLDVVEGRNNWRRKVRLKTKDIF